MTEAFPERIRSSSRYRALGSLLALLLGLGLATLHPLGLLVGGILVSLVARTPLRGLIAGFSFGVVVLIVFTAEAAQAGRLDPLLGAGLPAILAISLPLVLGTLGGLARSIY